MSASLRRHRADVFHYADAGTDGEIDSVYVRQVSPAADGMWWCSRATPTGREITIAAASSHRVDAVFCFAAVCPVTVTSAIRCAGSSYLVRAVLPRDHGRDEVQVLAESVVLESLVES